jgi:nicotinamidase-related amidase
VARSPPDARASAGTALLLIDFFNPLDFPGANRLAPFALAAARNVAQLRRRARAAGWPTVIANDHFGQWQSNFAQLAKACLDRGGASEAIARLLWPTADDIIVLKPRHSAFYGTPLEFLLAERSITRLVVTGIATDSCVLFSAVDAYLREFVLWIPGDCSAAKSARWHRRALEQMERSAKAWTGTSRLGLAHGLARAKKAAAAK